MQIPSIQFGVLDFGATCPPHIDPVIGWKAFLKSCVSELPHYNCMYVYGIEMLLEQVKVEQRIIVR